MNYFKIMAAYGFTMEEVAQALSEVAKHIPPPGDNEIELIKRNPNLNFIEKFFLIRLMKSRP